MAVTYTQSEVLNLTLDYDGYTQSDTLNIIFEYDGYTQSDVLDLKFDIFLPYPLMFPIIKY